MADISIHQSAHGTSSHAPADSLTRERNREAAERTLMAWIRTSLALIGFGFGIGKFYQYMESAVPEITLDPTRSALIFGGAFIAMGTFSLLFAVIQYARILSRIKQADFTYRPPWPLAVILSIGLLGLGIFTLLEMLISS